MIQKYNPDYLKTPVLGSDITLSALMVTKTTDYLSNNRIVANASGEIVQKNHYYPFGMPFADTPLAEQGIQPYKYNGKEYDQMHGLNLYDYGARMKADFGFTTMDPHCEKYYATSPYVYCGGNPVRYIDPDGMDWYEFENKNGTKSAIWQEGNAKTLDFNGQTYNNIGANYSYSVGNNIYSYEQNEMKSMSVSVLDREQFQSQFDSRFGNENRQMVACKRACDVMLSNAGVTSAGRNDATQQAGREVGTAKNHSITPTNNQTNGNRTLVQEVELNGNPIIVGVDRGKHGRGINDGTTDHWIVVSVYTSNLIIGTTSYNYFDPGNRNASQGANATNVLTRAANGLLINTKSRRTYTVTNIRPNTR